IIVAGLSPARSAPCPVHIKNADPVWTSVFFAFRHVPTAAMHRHADQDRQQESAGNGIIQEELHSQTALFRKLKPVSCTLRWGRNRWHWRESAGTRAYASA
ncbi:hypothetical protein, partial [uncultured Faecalibaculum sp.]|uniref:hypothetical protein n=1 Tax=uncultured Faecalibaculum sp. TaxID=1729681 RepID=UPI00272E20B8